MIDVEISIVNHGGCDITRSCLSSLPAACEGVHWHATVVDNASTDGTVGILSAEFPSVTFLCNRERHGFGANQNQVIGPAVESGTVRYVLVLNNDTELAPRSVTKLIDHADRNPALGAVSPRIVNPDGTLQPSSFRPPSLPRAFLSEIYPRAAPLGCVQVDEGELWLGGACLLLRPSALRDVGLFDTRFFLFFEDIDLARRLWDAGWVSATCAEATVLHHNHKTVSQEELRFPMACQVRRSCYLYIAKHYGTIPAIILALVGRAAMLCRAAVQVMAARLHNDEAAARHALLLRGLAKYNPREALPHELEGLISRTC